MKKMVTLMLNYGNYYIIRDKDGILRTINEYPHETLYISRTGFTENVAVVINEDDIILHIKREDTIADNDIEELFLLGGPLFVFPKGYRGPDNPPVYEVLLDDNNGYEISPPYWADVSPIKIGYQFIIGNRNADDSPNLHAITWRMWTFKCKMMTENDGVYYIRNGVIVKNSVIEKLTQKDTIQPPFYSENGRIFHVDKHYGNRLVPLPKVFYVNGVKYFYAGHEIEFGNFAVWINGPAAKIPEEYVEELKNAINVHLPWLELVTVDKTGIIAIKDKYFDKRI